jgi:hypothetical protein
MFFVDNGRSKSGSSHGITFAPNKCIQDAPEMNINTTATSKDGIHAKRKAHTHAACPGLRTAQQ